MKNEKKMKKTSVFLCHAGTMALLLTSCTYQICEFDSDGTRAAEEAGHSLWAVARQDSTAFIQYKAEMPLFTLDDIKSFNTETGEIKFGNIAFDVHLFFDHGCEYRVYFYEGGDLLFDARAVSWISSTGYFHDLTFQTIAAGNDGMMDAAKSTFYLRYGYPGIIRGDTIVENLKQRNAPGMERFIRILRQAGKVTSEKPRD